MSKVTWEVVSTFDWGVTSKMSYKTRELARQGMKVSKANFTNGGTTPVPNFVKWSLYRVEHLPGLSEISGEGVYIYKKVR